MDLNKLVAAFGSRVTLGMNPAQVNPALCFVGYSTMCLDGTFSCPGFFECTVFSCDSYTAGTGFSCANLGDGDDFTCYTLYTQSPGCASPVPSVPCPAGY